MPRATLDTFTLARGAVWRLLRYGVQFGLLGAIAAVIRGLFELRLVFDAAIFFASLFVAALLAGPMEALSQRSVRSARLLTKASLKALLFAGLWAAVVLLVFLFALPWRPVPFAVLAATGFAIGAALSALPANGGKVE